MAKLSNRVVTYLLENALGLSTKWEEVPREYYENPEGSIFAEPRQEMLESAVGGKKNKLIRFLDAQLARVLKRDPVLGGEPDALDASGKVVDRYGRRLPTESQQLELHRKILSAEDKFLGGRTAEDIFNPFTDELMYKKGTKVTQNVFDSILDEGISLDYFDRLLFPNTLKVIK